MRKLLLFLVAISFAQVSNAGFLIYPQKILFHGSMKKQSIKITNVTDTEKTYKLKIVNYEQEKNGGYKVITEENPVAKFASKNFRFSPRRVTLKPGKSQTINIMVKGKGALKDGEYRSHLAIVEKDATKMRTASASSGLGFEIKADYGVTVPVIIRKGKLNMDIKIKSAKLKSDKKGAVLSVDIARKGKKSMRGQFSIFDGKKEIGVIKNIVVYTNLAGRKFDVNLYKTASKRISKSALKGKKITIKYNSEDDDSLKYEVVKELTL
ncbi:MAG: fimbrial biogenesis chaperone [Alphaproteobacteria bacterium]|nr:MAG: hypothetical protein B6I23_00795 [Rickettsiaceae bacterium 4572_127]